MSTGHDAELAPLVDRLLREHELLPGAIDAVAIVAGPGSFTGVRVGSGFAIGFAAALGIPAAGVTTLEALHPSADDRCLGVLPAKQRPPDRTWWVQILECGIGIESPLETDEASLLSLAGAFERLIGSGLDAFTPTLDGRTIVEARPSALAAARRILETPRLLARSPAPVYVREPDAAPMHPR